MTSAAVPASQLVHVLDLPSAVEYLPAPQLVHVLDDVALLR